MIGFASCKKDPQILQMANANQLIGSWINPVYSDTLLVYKRALALVTNEYGITFLDSGNVVERKNDGWCATPPISCADFPGTWSLNGSILTINVAYWGGTSQYTWKIISLDNDTLKLYVVDQKNTSLTK